MAATEEPPPARGPKAVERALGTLLTLVALCWALDLPQRLNAGLDWLHANGAAQFLRPNFFALGLFTEQFLAAVLALALPLAYLTTSARRRAGGRAAWFDIACAVVGGLAAAYVAWRYPALQAELVYRPPLGIALGAVLIVLVIEGVRRTCGTALFVIILVFIALALFGKYLPGAFAARPVQWERLAVYLAFDTNAMIGAPLHVAAEVVIVFIFMGQIIQRGGGGQFFADLALALAGNARGGAGKIAVFGSMLFGTISGSAVANVASIGAITIPLMKRSGFQPHVAAATEALASTGGQLMPPVMGAAAFLMAERLGVPYQTVALAAIGPSLLYYFALFVFIDLYAARHRIRFAAVDNPVPLRRVLASGWHFPIPFIGLFVVLFWFNWSAQLSGLFTAALLALLCMVFGYGGKRMRLGDLGAAITGTGLAVVELILICAGAGLIIGVLNISGVAFGLTLQLAELASSHVLLLLLVTAAIAIILGMGMPTIGVYVLLAALIAPAMVDKDKAGLDEVAAHLFLLYYGMLSMVTPPVALAAFTAAGIAKANLWATGWQSIKIGWIAYLLPMIFVFQPSLLFRGSPWIGAADLATSALGAIFGTAALIGHFNRPIPLAFRAILVLAAVAVIMPVEAVRLGWAVNAAGLALGLAVLWLHRRPEPGALGAAAAPAMPGA
ncbi:MAG: TRAP transporter fused permease subunit [Rhodospirillaceae bacterium]|nr:TRAP transporter fused permease subunit [Rhodospirillaceae bacterium]